MVQIPIYYPDPSYIIGRFKKKAREFKDISKAHERKTQIKVSIETKKQSFKFVISQISEMEIKKALMNEEGLTFEQANKIFYEVIQETPNYVPVVENIVVSPKVCNTVCSKKLDLADVLHILIADRLKLLLITKEKKIDRWKSIYPHTLSEKQFQEMVKTLQLH
ncbi:MAG: hypothetical protein HYW50_01160 [Candidatus Diapherotrites archaeon]|nr:hypothetical protein [Candidatus Diapherotrites archaeon]